MKPTLASLFPNASQSCQKANPQLTVYGSDIGRVQGNVAPLRITQMRMNKTEAEFALRLEAMKRNGEILRYEYEGMTLRWAGMRYTPDFVVFKDTVSDDPQYRTKFVQIFLIEVKGGHIWDRDIVRFKGARAHWPEFAFELHQKKDGVWRRLH